VTDPTLPAPAGGNVVPYWPCWCDRENDNPDDAVTIYNTSGRNDGRGMVTGRRWWHHGISVKIRATRPDVGQLKARQIAAVFDQIIQGNSVTCPPNKFTDNNPHSYLVPCVTITSQFAFPAGKEVPKTERNSFTINAVCPIEELV
jgi:hypothetical protein